MDFGDEHNDETFGAEATEIGVDFDFSYNRNGGNGKEQRVLTVEELERQFQQQQQHHLSKSYASASGALPTARPLITQKLSVAELESQMLATSIKQPSPQPLVPQAIPPEHMAILQRIHQEDEEFKQRKAKYDGIMSDSDKNFIAKIQLSQLAGDPMYREDFYYKQWLAKKSPSTGNKSVPPPPIGQQQALDEASAGGKQSAAEETQQQHFEKLLSEVKIRPKVSQVDIKGALGAVAVNSLRNPKQIVQIKVKSGASSKEDSAAIATTQPQARSYKHTVGVIESIYLDLIVIDQMYARWKHEGAQLQADASAELRQQKHQEWNQEYTDLIKRIWRKLHSFDTYSSQQQQRSDADLLKISPSDSGVAMMISVGKGRKMLARVLKFLPNEMTLLLLKSILLATGRITTKTSLEPVQILAEMEDYANNVAFSFVGSISNAPINFIIDCIESARKSNRLMAIGKQKAGLLLLTLLISRAVLIKQKSPKETEIDPEYRQWSESVYPALFTAFEGHFNELFPPSHIMPSVISSRRSDSFSKPVPVDPQYVWQFFAAVAHCSSPDQQRIVVAELREKIIETVFQQGEAGSKKVNIFLNALGLDASQLMG